MQECKDEEYFNRKFIQNLCLPEGSQLYINAVLQTDSRCNQAFFPSAEYVANLCSVDPDGAPCISTNFFNQSHELYIHRLNSVCATSNVSCTSNCSESISIAKELSGCCINLYNVSRQTPEPVLSYSIWKSCEVETPGLCGSSYH